MNLSNLPLVDPARVGHGVFACINALQSFTPEQQIAAAAVLLQLYVRKKNLHVGTVLTVANNVIDRTLHATPELAGAMDYVRHEV